MYSCRNVPLPVLSASGSPLTGGNVGGPVGAALQSVAATDVVGMFSSAFVNGGSFTSTASPPDAATCAERRRSVSLMTSGFNSSSCRVPDRSTTVLVPMALRDDAKLGSGFSSS